MQLTRGLKCYFFAPRWHFSRFQFNLVSTFFLVLGGIGGSYLTVEKIWPQVFALNDSHQTWTFNSSTANSYTFDNTLVAINNSGAYPIGNELSNPDFATDTSSWNVGAIAPSGWTAVPGNSTYSTSEFLVMKYNAKCDGNADGVGEVTTSGTVCNGAENADGTGDQIGVYRNDGSACACTSTNNKSVVSSAGGFPIAYISQLDSITYCNSVAVGASNAHLITNDEWMTIARNAELQSSNWCNSNGTSCGNTPGTTGKILASGHNDNNNETSKGGDANSVIIASTDDSQACYGTTTDGSNNCGGSGSQKRTLALSNGEIVWDLGGNIRHWTNDTVMGADKPVGTAGSWVEWPSVTNYGVLSYNDFAPSISTYNSTQGIGQYYQGTNTGGPYAFLRGGTWNNGGSVGAFSATLDSGPSATNNAIGFRCASDPVAISQSFSSAGRGATGANTITVGNIADAKLYQSVNVGDTANYNFSVYLYDQTTGGEASVSAAVASLYKAGAALETTYTNVGDGWWKLSATVTGVNANQDYGVLVKAGKTVVVDDFTLSKATNYSFYTTNAYSNSQVNTWDTFCEGTLLGSVCTTDATYAGNATVKYQLCPDDGATCESAHTWQYWNGTAWQTATNDAVHVNTAASLTQAAMQALPTASQKIALKAFFSFDGGSVPNLAHISVGFTTDTTAPSVNASVLTMNRSNGGTIMASNDWTNLASPYFSWTAGADDAEGSGLKGYCLYLGTDPAGDPATTKGLLGTSPVTTAGTTCQFIVSATSIDFATAAFKGNPWLTTSSEPYYFNVKAVDNSGNVYGGDAASFQFRFDNTPPTNSAYISCASGSFSNVSDMNFSWPTSSSVSSVDDNSGVFGWQYRINTTVGPWLGTTSEALLGLNNYIPLSETSRSLSQVQDGDAINLGNNIVYLRTVDAAGNTSSDATIRTCNLSYGGAAPAFDNLDSVTVTPSSSADNLYALSWPAAMPTAGKNITHYYYMINTEPPATLATLQSNTATYFDNGTSLTVAAAALPNVNKGTNTVYVVAIDDATPANYSPSNYLTGTFTLNSTNPDNPANLVSSDSSIKSQSQWNVTLTWTAPSYKGAGNLTYLIYRSNDGITFSSVGSTSGLSYVDNTPASARYYYKIYAKDGANAQSSGTNAVAITPTGKWTAAPSLDSGPTVGSITTKKATITWSTSRTSDSKVQYGTTSGSYNTVEPSNSSQVTSHSIQLTGLNPDTTYYYKVKWTDEDGNTATSDEKNFRTAAAPTIKDVTAKNVGLDSAIVQFTSNNASKVKIYYGTSTSFGGVKEISTSTSETTYTVELSGLDDGTKYYYKINTFDSESSEYEGTILDFATLPRPRISNVRIQQVSNTAASTILVTWDTNTEISSIVTYYPQDNANAARDEVNVALTKGEHKMIIRGLLPQTDYILIVKGRDKIGNEAVSDSQRLTTATDTRPPQIFDLNVEGMAIPPTTSTAQESTAQLIVSWNTDELASSQVEFGEGTGTTYSSKTQEDSNLTFNHLVIISGLTPSKVYHLRAISKDKAGNIGNSIDTVTITPKATENALNLVITNLQEAFSFIGNLK